MKKIIAFLLAVLMLIGCTACSQRPDGPAPAPTKAPVETSAPAQPTQEPAAPETEEPAPTEEPAESEAPVETEAPAETPAPAPASKARLEKTEDAGTEYQDKFVFLGDSTTYGLKYYGVLSGGKNTTQVWTPSSGTLTLCYWSTSTIVYPDSGGEITIPTAAGYKQPEYMLITLGVNGVSFMDEEYFVNEYRDLINAVLEVSPKTKIIINSIYPVAEKYEHIAQINNEKISAANGWLEGLAEELGIPYLDTYSLLVGEDGFLREEYQNGDYIHLNETGFGIVLDNLRTHAYIPDEPEEVEPEPTPVQPAPESSPEPTPEPTEEPKITGIAIYFGFNQVTDITIHENEGDGYITLTGIVRPVEFESDNGSVWTIDDPSIAKITPKGRYCDVEIASYGSTTLTYSCAGGTSQCIIRCAPPLPKKDK